MIKAIIAGTAVIGGFLTSTASITTTGNWSGSSLTSPVSATARAITVPSGSSGQLTIANSGSSAARLDYRITGGAFDTGGFTNGPAIGASSTISITTGATLNFRSTIASGQETDGTVTDTGTGAAVGTITLINTS